MRGEGRAGLAQDDDSPSCPYVGISRGGEWLTFCLPFERGGPRVKCPTVPGQGGSGSPDTRMPVSDVAE